MIDKNRNKEEAINNQTYEYLNVSTVQQNSQDKDEIEEKWRDIAC